MNLVIKGDASFSSPEKVDMQNVLGKVVSIERNGRERRLGTKPYRIIGLFFAGISPFSRWIYPIGSRVKHKGHRTLGIVLEKFQSLKLYALLAKKFMKENIRYQIAVPADAPSLSRLYRYNRQPNLENPTDALKEQLRNPKDSGYWIVAKQKIGRKEGRDKIVGGVTLARFEPDDYPYEGWWIFGMKVNWRYRRMGIGEELTKMAIDIYGASEIKLLVFEDAIPANNLYQKLGFRRVSIPELDEQLAEEARETSRRRIVLTKNIQS
jgi:RimJ/RimL family protein N-acetyltransferase